MQEFFLINGYGVPKDIFEGDNYRTYLNAAFNAIYDASVRDGVEPVVIFSGGKTDMFKPYRRTEAGEMAKYFKALAKRPAVAKVTKTWKYELESQALSTLENLLLTHKILKKYPKIKAGTIVFEQSRAKRIHSLAKKVLAKYESLTFLPVDFDVSITRYDLELTDKKEAYALKMDLWSLASPKNLKVHHEIFADKIRTLRQAGPERHQEAIRAWWQASAERAKQAGL